MPDTPSEYLANDHNRLDDLFERATSDMSRVDVSLYDEFRKGLLRHIGLEEKIIFPLIAGRQGSAADGIIARLRRDHSAIVALLVPTPDASVATTLSAILARHNALEEGEGGAYTLLEDLVAEEGRGLLEQLRSAPEVPTHPTRPLAQVIEVTKRAVARSGYEFIEVE